MQMDKKTLVKAAGFIRTFQDYHVHDEWAQELYNYFVLGYTPGSFHTSCFANDLFDAGCRSHVGNEWQAIIAMMKWVNANAPAGSWGSYENVNHWLARSEEDRKQICIAHGWILSDEELTWALIAEEA